jgi:tetratricopeptide (TPR) repeat protein
MGLRVNEFAPAAPWRGGAKENRMIYKGFALGTLLAGSAVFMSSPAFAQYGPSAPATASQPQPQPQAANSNAAPQRKFDISKQARPALAELQAAVNAKDTANIPAKLAVAQAKAKTADDRYLIAQMQLKAAVDSNNMEAAAQAIDAMLASGVASPSELAGLYESSGQINYNIKAFDKAGTALEQSLKYSPNNVDTMIMLAETRNAQGRVPDAVAMIQKAIATRKQAGQTPDEKWFKRAIALSYNAKLPVASSIALDWVAAYPTPNNWRDAIRIYQTGSQLDDAGMIDSMRLAQAVNALTGESDYFRLANTLVNKGYAGEAKLVLEQGFAANRISKAKPTFSQLYSVATTKSQGDRASLAGQATAALAAPDAKKAMVVADAYYGYGDYAKAAELYRAALGKAGVDKDLANLRLGMALARSGDKAGATAALNAAGGAQVEVAKLWKVYVVTRG